MDKVSQIKEYYNLARVVAPYTGGLRAPLQTNWGNYMNGWCPFCQNGKGVRGDTRRFWVNVTEGLCNCFHPACAAHKPMDVINFWARVHNVSNDQAIRDLYMMMPGRGENREAQSS